MQVLAGFILCLWLEGIAWGTFVVWRKLTTPAVPPQPPRTPAQLANQAAYEANEADTPRIVSLRFQRHVRRGRRRVNLEREQDNFD